MNDSKTWKQTLGPRVPEAWGREIDIFETQIELRKRGKIEEKLFAETRLRRGAYGQRYDNGQRHDGEKTQALVFPSKDITKGPSTLWDAPGMQRIKIPMGKLGADQLDVLADVAEEYSDRILHVTTRQDFQLHFIHIEDTPDMHRRLAAVGITTREACGNTVRNVTACPFAGVCRTEAFDVTPYAHALTYFLLGHDDTQDFGRKFKIAFSGCRDNACGLTNFHDIGAIARTREIDGKTCAASSWYVGGGLGAVPQAAQAVRRVPARRRSCCRSAQAMSRVFARLGEKSQPRAAPASSSWSRSWASRSSSGWCWKSAPSCGPIRAGRRSWPTCTPPTRSRCARPGRCPPDRCPKASPTGARPTSCRSGRPATSWRPSRCRSAT